MARVSYQKGSVEQRERRYGTVYVLRYRLRQDRKWVEKTEELRNQRGDPCGSHKEAQKAADKRMAEINQSNNCQRRELTVSEFSDTLWQDHRKRIKVSTAYTYDSLLNKYILPMIGKKTLAEVTPREKAGSTAWSLRNIYGLLNVMFDIAVEYDLIEVSPVRKRLHRPEVESTEKPSLTAEQVRKVIKATSDEHRPALLMVALTGLRIGELLALRWKNIDFSSTRLTVTHTLWEGQLLEPKTRRSRRSIHLPAALVNALQLHFHRSRFTKQDDFVFAREDGTPYSSQHLRDYILYPALERAGIQRVKGQHGFHLFRHSAASIVYEATKDLKLGQELLGQNHRQHLLHAHG